MQTGKLCLLAFSTILLILYLSFRVNWFRLKIYRSLLGTCCFVVCDYQVLLQPDFLLAEMLLVANNVSRNGRSYHDHDSQIKLTSLLAVFSRFGFICLFCFKTSAELCCTYAVVAVLTKRCSLCFVFLTLFDGSIVRFCAFRRSVSLYLAVAHFRLWFVCVVTRWSGHGGIEAWSQRPSVLWHSLGIGRVKIVPEMAYDVSSGTLTLYTLPHILAQSAEMSV